MATALVTGAARGIGAAAVRTLVAQGWNVVALDVTGPVAGIGYALATPAELEALAGPQVQVVTGDCRSSDVLTQAVDQAGGTLDAAIACAGVIAGGVPLWQTDPAADLAVLEVDLHAVITLAKVAIPALLARPEPRQGRFVAVASAAATKGLPMLAAYCAAKAGVTGLVRALAVELGGTGITANAVSPGSTDTAMLAESARIYDLAGAQDFALTQPHGRLLAPEEVAAAIAFLASPASSGMTGASVPVDGGLAL